MEKLKDFVATLWHGEKTELEEAIELEAAADRKYEEAKRRPRVGMKAADWEYEQKAFADLDRAHQKVDRARQKVERARQKVERAARKAMGIPEEKEFSGLERVKMDKLLRKFTAYRNLKEYSKNWYYETFLSRAYNFITGEREQEHADKAWKACSRMSDAEKLTVVKYMHNDTPDGWCTYYRFTIKEIESRLKNVHPELRGPLEKEIERLACKIRHIEDTAKLNEEQNLAKCEAANEARRKKEYDEKAKEEARKKYLERSEMIRKPWKKMNVKGGNLQ